MTNRETNKMFNRDANKMFGKLKSFKMSVTVIQRLKKP